MLSMVAEASARHFTEERLRMSEERFGRMMESSTEGMCIVDADIGSCS
jgi:PAS domain-containing protein